MFIDSPIGTPEERATGIVWPGKWYDATPFATRYRLRGNVMARHTGADLNLHDNKDAGAPIYAIASGIVTASKKIGSSWGWVVVIEHEDDEGNPFYSRSAHVNHIQFPVVRKGDVVTMGKVIAYVGNADGAFSHHLHFDISHTTVLKRDPGHWPGDVDAGTIRRNYVDPRAFIIEKMQGPLTPPDPPSPPVEPRIEKMKVDATKLFIRAVPSTMYASTIIGEVFYGDVVEVKGNHPGSGYNFAELVTVNGRAFTHAHSETAYIAREYLDAI